MLMRLVETPQVIISHTTLLGSGHMFVSPKRRDPRTPSQAATVRGGMEEKNNTKELPKIN